MGSVTSGISGSQIQFRAIRVIKSQEYLAGISWVAFYLWDGNQYHHCHVWVPEVRCNSPYLFLPR